MPSETNHTITLSVRIRALTSSACTRRESTATGNRRNFRSQRITQATSYSVEVPSDRLAAAQQILAAGR